MKKSVESMRVEMQKIRTGRASTALLDHLYINYYGSKTPIAQMATVGVKDSRTLSVTVWDKSMLPALEKAIMESDLGLNPMTAGDVIHVPLPPLTEERRKEMTKIVRGEGENGKIAIRNIRRDVLSDAKDLRKEKEISEDEEKRAIGQVQKITDKYVSRIDDLVHAKEQEVMEV